MSAANDPRDGETWNGEDPDDDVSFYGDEEEEFNEEDWEEVEEKDEGEEDMEATEGEGPLTEEYDGDSASQSRLNTNEGSDNGGEEEGEEGEEDGEYDSDQEIDDYDEDVRNEENEGGNDGSGHSQEKTNTTGSSEHDPAFSAGTASAPVFAQTPAFTNSTLAPSTACGQTRGWSSAAGSDSGARAMNPPSVLPQFAPSAAVFPTFPAPPQSTARPFPTSFFSNSGAADCTVWVSGSTTQSPSGSSLPSPPLPISASATTPMKKREAALSLQFVDFKRSFGQTLRRSRSSVEEMQDVKMSLARYELVVPTDRFDDQIERVLYGC